MHSAESHILALFLLCSEIVPEAPVITLEGDVLQWNRPDDNGSPITEYQIIAMYVYMYMHVRSG